MQTLPSQSETYGKNVLTSVIAKSDNYNVHIRKEKKKGQKLRKKYKTLRKC